MSKDMKNTPRSPLKFTPFPTLNTERLVLRRAVIADCPAILFLRSDKTVNKYIQNTLPKTLEDAKDFFDKIENWLKTDESIYWCISLKESPEMVGSICLWNFSPDEAVAEVGYALHPDFQNKGIMTEALKCVLHFGFEQLALTEIEAFTDCHNGASISLLKKNNFILKEGKKDEANVHNIIFGITKNVWEARTS